MTTWEAPDTTAFATHCSPAGTIRAGSVCLGTARHRGPEAERGSQRGIVAGRRPAFNTEELRTGGLTEGGRRGRAGERLAAWSSRTRRAGRVREGAVSGKQDVQRDVVSSVHPSVPLCLCAECRHGPPPTSAC